MSIEQVMKNYEHEVWEAEQTFETLRTRVQALSDRRERLLFEKSPTANVLQALRTGMSSAHAMLRQIHR